jgi:hypothetical protein
MPTPSEFERILEIYRTNLIQYKLSGNESFKQPVENSKKWLDDFLVSQNTAADARKQEIETFMRTYDTANPDMSGLKTDMAKIRENGPKLQTLYETEKEGKKIEPIDDNSYVKLAVLGSAIAVVFGAMFF